MEASRVDPSSSDSPRPFTDTRPPVPTGAARPPEWTSAFGAALKLTNHKLDALIAKDDKYTPGAKVLQNLSSLGIPPQNETELNECAKLLIKHSETQALTILLRASPFAELNLSGFDLSKTSRMTSLADALDSLSSVRHSLQRIGLSGCKIDAGVIDLLVKRASEALGRFTHIDLSNNALDHKGAKAVVRILSHNMNLVHLDLAGNRLGDQSAHKLAAELKHNVTLTALNLSNNHVGAKGGKELSEALKDNSALTTIDLSQNKILKETSEAITVALSRPNWTRDRQLFDIPCQKNTHPALVALIEKGEFPNDQQSFDYCVHALALYDAAFALKNLVGHSPFETLTLKGNEATLSLQFIHYGLANNPKIKRITISEQSPIPQFLIAQSIAWMHLTHVNLSACTFNGDLQVIHLASKLENNKPLISLHLPTLAPHLRAKLAEKLRGNQTLLSIGLEAEQVDDELTQIVRANQERATAHLATSASVFMGETREGQRLGAGHFHNIGPHVVDHLDPRSRVAMSRVTKPTHQADKDSKPTPPRQPLREEDLDKID
jgi:hypothetical protein